jgi:hypothetical protein
MLQFRCSPAFYRLRELFTCSLDSYWFMITTESSPLGDYNLRPIREFLYGGEDRHFDERDINERLDLLEIVVDKVREQVVPVIKEKLQISSLAPDDMVQDHEEFVFRQFVAYTLPHNLKELGKLIRKLRLDLGSRTACL